MVIGWDKGARSAPRARTRRDPRRVRGAFPRRCRRGFDLRGASGGANHRIVAGNRAAGFARCAGHGCFEHEAIGLRAWRRNRFSEERAHFLGGHPMAGKEISGIAAADAELFRGSKYALIRRPRREEIRRRAPMPRVVAEFVALIEKLGAEPIWLDAEAHDRAAAVVSHLPQLLAVALAGVVRNQTDETGLPVTLAGRGLRDALRLAGSPYSVWRDIILTNSDNLDRVLDQMIQALEQLRGELRTRALEEQFAAAGELYKILRDLQ